MSCRVKASLPRWTAFVGLLALLFACSPAKHSYRVAQICLSNQQGIVQFVHEMKSIAVDEGMEYVDGSEDTERGLDTIGYADRGRADGSPTIHLGVQRHDGMGMTAVNVSLPSYQVALFFYSGSNESEARQFADGVIARFERHWHVDVFPGGSSVIPDPKCR